ERIYDLPPLTFQIYIEERPQFIQRIAKSSSQRVRLLQPISEQMKPVFSKSLVRFCDAKVLANGHFELKHFLREVSLSYDTHRYGNLCVRPESIKC
ncbi:hypothetical protein N9Y92_04515, partial [Chlamydiales bacterium]|nr:hypothetical protein [Chlamydiales bacterium]